MVTFLAITHIVHMGALLTDTTFLFLPSAVLLVRGTVSRLGRAPMAYVILVLFDHDDLHSAVLKLR